ncbi:MAG: hypothetical protein Q8P45_02865 [Candidatus Harrisonbacteria bacterium]|nr:hypothetical protein [Candidatus Harrisonbacteria bacterium]
MKKIYILLIILIIIGVGAVLVFSGDKESTKENSDTSDTEMTRNSRDNGLPADFFFEERKVLLKSLLAGKSVDELSDFFANLDPEDLKEHWYQLKLSYVSGKQEKSFIFDRELYTPTGNGSPSTAIAFASFTAYNDGNEVNEKGETKKNASSIRDEVIETIEASGPSAKTQLASPVGTKTIFSKERSCEKIEFTPGAKELNTLTFYTVSFVCEDQLGYPSLNVTVFIDSKTDMVSTAPIRISSLTAASEFQSLSQSQKSFATRDIGAEKVIQPLFSGRPAGAPLKFSEADYEFMMSAVAQRSGIDRSLFESGAFKP